MESRSKDLKKASYIAMFGNSLLALLKLTIGTVSGSIAVISDGIDSTTDIVISAITLFTARVIDKPSDREHPYGHTRAETMATTLLAFIVFFAGAQLLLGTFHDIFEGKKTELPSILSVFVTIVSIVGKLLLAWSQFAIGRKTGSRMLVANGKNMRNDVLISCGVLLGLIFTFLFRLPILDSVTALLVSVWIGKTALGIFREASLELMDGNDDPELYTKIFEAVRSVKGAGNPHRTRVRRLSQALIIDLDIEVEGRLRVEEAHEIAKSVETAIKDRIENVYDVIVHIEPMGNIEEGEKFGLTTDTKL